MIKIKAVEVKTHTSETISEMDGRVINNNPIFINLLCVPSLGNSVVVDKEYFIVTHVEFTNNSDLITIGISYNGNI